jgi:hypothetical protein
MPCFPPEFYRSATKDFKGEKHGGENQLDGFRFVHVSRSQDSSRGLDQPREECRERET